MAENWTDLAPHRDPVPPGKKWHVFVSDRSMNRPWGWWFTTSSKALATRSFSTSTC